MEESTSLFSNNYKGGTSMLSKFKRSIYQQLEASVEKEHVIFILGPRKCGKTYAMQQLCEAYPNAKYIDVKKDIDETIDAMHILFEKIKASHDNNENIIYLIDEVTYLCNPEWFISDLYYLFNLSEPSATRVVLAGSQSVALQYWEGKYFCGCCKTIRGDFIDYAEWMRYKNYTKPTAENYLEYLNSVAIFHNVKELSGYLHGCIDETIISNNKAYTAILNNNVDRIDTEILLDIMFCAMVNIHLGVTYQTFIDRATLQRQIYYHFSSLCTEEVADTLTEILSERYMHLRNLSDVKLKQALVFLYRNGLVDFTWRGTRCTHLYLASDIISDSFPEFELNEYGRFANYKEQLFEHLGIYIKHPAFYVAILQEIFKDDYPDSLPSALLGEIVECNVRGLLPSAGQFEYHEDETDTEIDYVNGSISLAVEITVSDRHKIHFDVLKDTHPDISFIKILLTKTKEYQKEDIYHIPYYKYIYHLASGGKANKPV